jgi:hypothetical protein
MSNVDTIVEVWFAAWRPVDETERRRLLEICWSQAGVYQDPMNDASGREAVMELIASFHERRPGARIDVVASIIITGNYIIFGRCSVQTGKCCLRASTTASSKRRGAFAA